MYVCDGTLDDILHRVLTKLLRARHTTASRGDSREVVGALLRLKNPRARLSRSEVKGKLFSCLGELLWYLSGTDDVNFVSYYISRYRQESEDEKTIHGAYGPRLFGGNGRPNQMDAIVELLRSARRSTRRAVIPIFEAGDIVGRMRKEVPCTTALQFLLRGKKLHLVANMRSNDAYVGLPHDVFAFTMLQEIVARKVGVELGTYTHMVGSLHLYDEHVPMVHQYLAEGWHESEPMPHMPVGDPQAAIEALLEAERCLRLDGALGSSRLTSHSYWRDIVRVLQVFAVQKHEDDPVKKARRLGHLRSKMASHVYDPYIERKQQAATLAAASVPAQVQLPLFSPDPTSREDIR